MTFKSTHDLSFEAAEWELSKWGMTELMGSEFKRFRIGTCSGLWQSTDKSYDILAIDNSKRGNGHFDDVLEWFENSCKRDKKHLMFLEVWNEKLMKHLIEKRGFIKVDKFNLIKSF